MINQSFVIDKQYALTRQISNDNVTSSVEILSATVHIERSMQQIKLFNTFLAQTFTR